MVKQLPNLISIPTLPDGLPDLRIILDLIGKMRTHSLSADRDVPIIPMGFSAGMVQVNSREKIHGSFYFIYHLSIIFIKFTFLQKSTYRCNKKYMNTI